MLARSRTISHPLGITFSTPLLVPSFSSKGFRVEQMEGDRERSEADDLIQAASECLTDSMLVSAFDLYYRYVSPIEHAVTEITILDSGGYETSDVQDLSSVRVEEANHRPWSAELYQKVIAEWPAHVPAIFVSLDSSEIRQPLEEQIAAARALFGQVRGGQMTALLVKPERPGQQHLETAAILANARELRAFDVIGVTEKELGNSTLDRMVAVARIRRILNENGVTAPIHVFGSLDPITVPLYFLAGAEIFDGLTWLRYGFDRDAGAALYRTDHAAREIGIDRRDDLVKLMTMQGNLGVITTLRNRMRRFLNDNDYEKFGPNAKLIREAVDLLETRIGKGA